MQNKAIIIGLVAVLAIGGITAFTLIKQNNNRRLAVDKQNDLAMMKKGEESAMEDKAMMDDSHLLGVVMSAGKLMTLWPGNELASLSHDITLKNGTKVSMAGQITASNGYVLTLKDGQELSTNGDITTIDTSKLTMMKEEKASTNSTDTKSATTGSTSTYVDYSPQVLTDAETAQKSGRKVVLFFHANWCPFCIAADKDFRANIGTDKFPKNVTLIKTDYDSQTELKNKYGVNHQHTFVQIDSNGNQITKWISGETPELNTNLQ